MDRKWEILAPAGSIEQLKAAVNNGCDSVYLGLDQFNARMKAPNFTADNLREWIDYCHFFGVKVYVAVNTSIKNNEFGDAWNTVLTAYNNCADGVILTDLKLIEKAGKLPKPFDVVASTQLNIHDYYGAEFVKKLGATTVVCSRECSYEQISDIVRSGLNVECFLHGALCVCQSGQCLFSSMVGGNSGNRGLCAQPCRKIYTSNFDNRSSGYFLSARDICSLDTAEKLYSLGVSTFKIEGRNRRAEYAGITSRIYQKLFTSNFKAFKGDYEQLAEMYNRGMASNRYLDGANDDVIYSKIQNHTGILVGVVSGNGVKCSLRLNKGDGLKVIDGSGEVCGGVVLESGASYVRAEFTDKVTDGMRVYRTTSQALCKDVLDSQRNVNITMKFTAKAGERVTLAVKCDTASVTLLSDFVVEEAHNSPVSKDQIAEQLQKTACLQYTITDIAININNIFIAKSQINALRREALEKLKKIIIDNYNKKFATRKSMTANLDNGDIQTKSNNNHASNSLAVICRNLNEIEDARNNVDVIIYKPEFIGAESLNVDGVFVDLPSFADMEYIRSVLNNNDCGIVCHNVGHVEFARSLNIPYIAGSGLNVFNDEMAMMFSDAKAFVYSPELTLNEISQFHSKNGYIFVDGLITLMKLVHCPFKLIAKSSCENCKAAAPITYIDEKGNEFNIIRRKDKKCSFELLNGRKLSVVNRLKDGGRYLIDYDELIVKHYQKINNGEVSDFAETRPYTKGRLYSKIN